MMEEAQNMIMLDEKNIVLNAKFTDKWSAIQACGRILLENGYVKSGYLDEMIAREKSTSVYIGSGVAIPHGLAGYSKNIIHSGLSFVQVPEGVDFDGNTAYLLIGIAGKGDEHLQLLSQVALTLMDESRVAKLVTTNKKADVMELLKKSN